MPRRKETPNTPQPIIDEIVRKHREGKSVKSLAAEYAQKIIDEYLYFYNHERLQLKTKLTPLEKRCQYVA